MTRIRVVAFAKVNLSLEVLCRRTDGFHEVRSIMQSISLADELLLEDAPDLNLECDLPDLREDNLVIRAVQALREVVGETRGARIELHKGIPVASGLGGASADAAATLVALAELWGAEISGDRMSTVAASLGSDVPFFLSGGTALVRGRGEEVVRLPDAPPSWLVLLVPPHDVVAKTAALYRRLTPQDWSSGSRTEEMAREILDRRPFPLRLLHNSFERVADEVFPSLAEYRAALLGAGAASVHLSGAGPALFSVFQAEDEAASVARCLRQESFSPLLARTIDSLGARPRPSQPD